MEGLEKMTWAPPFAKNEEEVSQLVEHKTTKSIKAKETKTHQDNIITSELGYLLDQASQH